MQKANIDDATTDYGKGVSEGGYSAVLSVTLLLRTCFVEAVRGICGINLDCFVILNESLSELSLLVKIIRDIFVHISLLKQREHYYHCEVVMMIPTPITSR